MGYLFRDEGTRYAPAMIDLKNASRDALIRLVVAQHETIAQQERTIAELRGVIATLEATVAQLTQRVGELLAAVDAARDEAAGTGRPQGMPGLKPNAVQFSRIMASRKGLVGWDQWRWWGRLTG